MKPLQEYITEKLIVESRWTSCEGGFNQEHVKDLAKLTSWKEDKIKGILDDWEKKYGGPVEYEYNGKELIFKNSDANKTWKFNKKWEEV